MPRQKRDTRSKAGIRGAGASIEPLTNWRRRVPVHGAQKRAERWLNFGTQIAARFGRNHSAGNFLEHIFLRAAGLRALQRRVIHFRPRFNLVFPVALHAFERTISTFPLDLPANPARPAAFRSKASGLHFESPAIRQGHSNSHSSDLFTLFTGACATVGTRTPNQFGCRNTAQLPGFADRLCDRSLMRFPRGVREILTREESAPVRFVRRRISQTVRCEDRLIPVLQVYAAPAQAEVPSGGRAQDPLEFHEIRPGSAEASFSSSAALPANVAQITEHVISQLDRRLLAWRERMGRT